MYNNKIEFAASEDYETRRDLANSRLGFSAIEHDDNGNAESGALSFDSDNKFDARVANRE